MSSGAGQRAFWMAAGAALLAGMVMTLLAPSHLGAVQQRIDRRLKDLDQLDEYQRRDARYREAIRQCEQMPATNAVTLDTLLRGTLTNAMVDVRDNGAEPSLPGWSVRQASVVLKNATYEELERLLPRLETSRPPWRITSMAIGAGRQAGQIREVTLNLEMLQRSGAM